MVVGEFTQETQLVVIGGGPGGYSAAFRAAELGIQTTIVDTRSELGGVCLHDGCIPSKTLLNVVETLRLSKHAEQLGITFGSPQIDLQITNKWIAGAVNKLAMGLGSQAKKFKVDRIIGEAKFEDQKNIAISGGSVPRLKFRRAIIATGSTLLPHPNLPFDGDRIIPAAKSLHIESVPRTTLVVGNGYQAVEIACIYSALGSKLTLAAEEKTLLPHADDDLVRPFQKVLKSTIHELKLGVEINSALADQFEKVIVAGKNKANIDSLGLEATKVKLDENGFVIVDEQMKTSDLRIMAVGDVTGQPLLADVALAQGRVAGEVVAGQNSAFDVIAVPHAVFTDPQIAWCGLTEKEAKAKGVSYKVTKLPWGASGKAVGMGRTDGMTKIIYDPEWKTILGVGIVGIGACELIGKGTLAVEMGAELTDLAQTLLPHPTMSELISDAARNT